LVADRTPRNTPLALLPQGTENLLARHFRLSGEPDATLRLIQAGCLRQLDAGRANGRMFLLMAGCGFDAEVVRRLHASRAGHIHHLSYAKPIVESIRNYAYPSLRVGCRVTSSADVHSWQRFRAHWVFAFNAPAYAGNLCMVPDALPDDGQLDLATFTGGSLWHGLYHLSAIMLGQHRSLSGFRSIRTDRIRVESDQPVPWQVDGDPGGFLPLEIDLLPKRVTLLVPAPSGSAAGNSGTTDQVESGFRAQEPDA
jgi:diacylglycerol kinase family enzyme